MSKWMEAVRDQQALMIVTSTGAHIADAYAEVDDLIGRYEAGLAVETLRLFAKQMREEQTEQYGLVLPDASQVISAAEENADLIERRLNGDLS